jgi:predicted nucleic acid-binding protein
MYLLDTNVISELRKVGSGRANTSVALWADSVNAADLYISVITVQELEIGVALALRRDAQQGAVLRNWMDRHLLPAFENRILPVDLAVAQRSAQLNVPDPRPVRDGLIAATALVHAMTVVTRNVADFQQCGVSLINPWDWVL